MEPITINLPPLNQLNEWIFITIYFTLFVISLYLFIKFTRQAGQVSDKEGTDGIVSALIAQAIIMGIILFINFITFVGMTWQLFQKNLPTTIAQP